MASIKLLIQWVFIIKLGWCGVLSVGYKGSCNWIFIYGSIINNISVDLLIGIKAWNVEIIDADSSCYTTKEIVFVGRSIRFKAESLFADA